jgi:hypothetical protein
MISAGSPGRATFLGDPVPVKRYAGKWPESSPALLVWYEPNEKEHLYSPDELDSLANFELLFDSEDGRIFRIEN